MNDTLNTIAVNAMVYLIPILAGLLVEYVRRKIGNERITKIQGELATKKELADTAVKFAQQVYWELDGPKRFAEATTWLSEQAGKLGLKMTDSEIKGLIESAVKAMKDGAVV